MRIPNGFKYLLVSLYFLSGLLLGLSLLIPSSFFLMLGYIGIIACILYIFVLVLYLYKSPTEEIEILDEHVYPLSNVNFEKLTIYIIFYLVFIFFLGIFISTNFLLPLSLTFIAISIIFNYRDLIDKKSILLGILSFFIVFIAFLFTDTFNIFMIIYLSMVPFLFVAGVILLRLISFTKIQAVQGNYFKSIKGFFIGCILAFPPSLLNIFGGSGQQDLWIIQWWEPILAAFIPAICEEVWARLFLVSLIAVLLIPRKEEKIAQIIILAVIIGAIVHGLSHIPSQLILGPAGISYLIIGMLYGVPMGMLFVKKDLEHAIGYHYFIDLIRFLVAFLIL